MTLYHLDCHTTFDDDGVCEAKVTATLEGVPEPELTVMLAQALSALVQVLVVVKGGSWEVMQTGGISQVGVRRDGG